MRTRTRGSNIITSRSVEICKSYGKKLLQKFSIDCDRNNLMHSLKILIEWLEFCFQGGVACLLSDFVSVCMWFVIVTWDNLF